VKNSAWEYKFLVASIFTDRSHSKRTSVNPGMPGIFLNLLRLFDTINTRKNILKIALIAKNSFPQSAVTSAWSLVVTQYKYLAW
jgi:hypothetical protein